LDLRSKFVQAARVELYTILDLLADVTHVSLPRLPWLSLTDPTHRRLWPAGLQGTDSVVVQPFAIETLRCTPPPVA
jgi:hypothetical protein